MKKSTVSTIATAILIIVAYVVFAPHTASATTPTTPPTLPSIGEDVALPGGDVCIPIESTPGWGQTQYTFQPCVLWNPEDCCELMQPAPGVPPVTVPVAVGVPPVPAQTLPETGAREAIVILAVAFSLCCVGWVFVHTAKRKSVGWGRMVDSSYGHHGGE